MDKQASYFLTDVVLMGGRVFTASSNDMYCEAKVAILSDGTSRIEAVFKAAAYLIENQEFMVIRHIRKRLR